MSMSSTNLDDLALLRDSVDRWVERDYPLARHRAAKASAAGYDEAAWREFAELGWLGLPVADEHGGVVPRTREELEKLPGVGRKTANVVLNTIFGEPTIAVDTHIFRVANRTRIATGETPREVEDALIKFTPGEFAHDAHHWLILHGRYVCKALKPECARCFVNDLCEYPLRRKLIAASRKAP